MKHEKSRNHDVILNSTQRNFGVAEEEHQIEANIFSEQQLRMLSRYKKFSPFKKDENLLWRKMLEGDNIWLKKFKDSWQKRK